MIERDGLDTWQAIEKMRAQAPVVHSITNYVVINIGTLSQPWVKSMFKAAEHAAKRGIPIVLDPVGAGATQYRCVQLREKDLSTRAFVAEAAQMKALLTRSRVPLIINDRVDEALAAGADGVHVGQTDMPCELVRRLMGPAAIIGLSVETWEEEDRAEDQPVDYLGVSPIFATPTKTDTRCAWGLEGLARIRDFSRHPLVAIGGLNASNIADVVRTGAEGIAVVSAICAATDPRRAAACLRRRIEDCTLRIRTDGRSHESEPCH